ncbi:hypothetical protein AUR04nite_04680 [Glutamicibacter uratoxydans]|uniref:Lipoprotein n=1 Tax=Glutamicibacter uratoxydans TaxID=43667 RepID=A0A4Y4DIZ8_GLUUR|nr:hypothetical protein [Glutamicibacter uratoxydans]GED04936.1 hypothetical protein AUR04nite_04680 [Glutamicibacter uratoxydans]
MKRTKALGFTSLALASALALAGCSGSGDKAGESTTPSPTVSSTTSESPVTTDASPTESSSPTESASESSTESAEADAKQADNGKLKIYKATSPSYTDTVMGHKFQVTGVALDFKGEGEFAEAPGKDTYVAVQYKVTAGDKYFNGTSCTNTKLASTDSPYPRGDSTSIQKKAMEKAGLTPMGTVRQGESTEGWCLYYVPNPTTDNLTANYSRLAMKDSKKTYKEESKDLKITVEK